MTDRPEQIPTGDEAIRATVREQYGQIASTASSCCGPAPAAGCYGGNTDAEHLAHAERIGYQPDEAGRVPEANLGLGCGNPTALAGLRPGEVVLDLGAGAGMDAFIAADEVGPDGRVIGVDMTVEMLERARINAVKAGHARTVEFREGLIEDLPVVSNSVDVVISNCVINLSPDKPRVFREIFRALKPGGRLAVSDIVLSAPLPDDIAQLAAAYVGCIAGALPAEAYLGAIEAAGFVHLRFVRTSAAALLDALRSDPKAQAVIASIGAARIEEVAATIFSYGIEARKP